MRNGGPCATSTVISTFHPQRLSLFICCVLVDNKETFGADPMACDSQRQLPHFEHVTDWQPQNVQRCLAASSRNFVGLMDDGSSVLKYPQRKTANAMEALREEAARYHRLGRHENLVFFKGLHEDGLIFEFCTRGDLGEVIRNRPSLSENEKDRIGDQVIRGLIHLHDHNFIHGDLNVNNVFITSSGDAKLGDIQGQLYRPDGTVEMPTMSQEGAKSRHPHASEDEFTVRTDIFALGTLLYHLWHGHSPFPDLDEYRHADEIQARFQSREYPFEGKHRTKRDVIVSKCWESEYKHATDLLRDVSCLRRSVLE